jgi:hypothetical protein
LQGVPRPFVLEESIAGIEEEWVKWSFASMDLHILYGSLRESGPWLKVRKERFMRRYAFQTGVLMETSGPEETVRDAGCNIEVTAVETDVKPGSWVTCAFEAFGPMNTGGQVLSQTLHQFFQERGPIPGVQLAEKQSFGYPAWISSLMATRIQK